jgi:hypothetical protein
VLTGRPCWVVEGRVAVYRPAGGDWVGRVCEVLGARRASRRWHAALLRDGRAVYVIEIVDVIAAAEWVERQRLTPAAGPSRGR